MKQIEKNNNNFVHDIKSIVSEAKTHVSRTINSTMVKAYWLIGKRIVEEEQNNQERADYAKYIIENISKELKQEFGRGYSVTNIKYFRQFYRTFPYDFNLASIGHSISDQLDMAKRHFLSDQFKDSIHHTLCDESELEILQILFTKLSWTHVRQILRVKNPEARDYYIREAANNSWVVETLDRNIATQYYERLFLSHAKDEVETEMIENTKDFQTDKNEFLKSPAVLEFLNIPENYAYSEADLEKAIIDNLQKFLLELGKGYAFVERQQLVRTKARDYHVMLI